MKIAFFCGWSFGLRGTPGTYKFIEKNNFYHDIIVFSPPHSKDCVFKVKTIPMIPFQNPGNPGSIEDIIPALRAFNPQIVYIFNFPKWPSLLNVLKDVCQQSKFILDIKTPLLAEGKNRQQIQAKSNAAQIHLDAIVTLSKESVPTWIPKCTIKPFEYPLGIDLSLYNPKPSFRQRDDFKNYVYVSTLHPKRQTERLINGFVSFVKKYNSKAVLDIFGSGPELPSLKELIAARNLQETIQLRGLVQQDNLLPMLSDYDAGIAWVPTERYNDSPSLKILEYMAAGLPVIATNTKAHTKLLDQGFSLDLFNDNTESLSTALKQLSENGFSKNRILKNLKSVTQFDYDRIIRNYFLPLFEQVVSDFSIKAVDAIKQKPKQPQFTAGQFPQDQMLIDKKLVCRTENKRRLKLFFFCNTLAGGKGGAERVAMELANEMTKRGHLVYMGYQNRGPAAYAPKHGVVMIPYDRLDVLGTQIRTIDPDVFFVFYFNRRLIEFYSMIHQTNIPFGIQECTNPQRLCENNWGLGKLGRIIPEWERELIASAAARIRLTMPQYALSFPEYIRPQIRSYANPAFPQNILAHPAGNTKHRKTILNINGFKANKNLITLLKAFARLAHDFPEWDVKVIGKSPDGKEPHKRAILKFIQEHNLQDRVMIHGPTDDVHSHYAASHIHVIASLSEGCPAVVLEAMSVGLPSIGHADCPGTNELIRHEINGLLAAPEDRVAGMEVALQHLMSFSELRARLGRQALEDSKAFEPQTFYDQWEQLFFEAAEYKNDPKRLLREQMDIAPEHALHTRRMRDKLLQQYRRIIP
jgi:glycosyltransferase involved in cell wall biosynthesis